VEPALQGAGLGLKECPADSVGAGAHGGRAQEGEVAGWYVLGAARLTPS
jgi:hypothetical protein